MLGINKNKLSWSLRKTRSKCLLPTEIFGLDENATGKGILGHDRTEVREKFLKLSFCLSSSFETIDVCPFIVEIVSCGAK